MLSAVLLLAPAARGDDSDGAWRNLLMSALAMVSANNLPAAEQLYIKALRQAETFGQEDPRVGATLNSLGLVYKAEKKYPDAESSFRHAQGILEKAYGAESIDAGNVSFNIASVLMEENKQPGAALPYLQRSLFIYQKQFGNQSLKAASVLCMTGDAYRAMKSWPEAEAPLKQCAQIREEVSGILNPDLGEAANSLALVYKAEGKYLLADGQFKLAERIRERSLGIMSPAFADTLEAHAEMLRALGRDKEAEKDATLAAAIRRNEQKTK